MSDQTENDLRELARVRMSYGLVPTDVPTFVRTANVARAQCSLCSSDIMAHEIKYEVAAAGGRHFFHFRCHAAWSLECLGLSAAADE